MTDTASFLVGICLLLISQILRGMRLKTLFPFTSQFSNKKIVLYSAWGSFFNLILPISGDFVKGMMISRTYKCDLASLVVSLVYERYSDLICIFLILLTLYFMDHSVSNVNLQIALFIFLFFHILIFSDLNIEKMQNSKSIFGFFIYRLIWNLAFKKAINPLKSKEYILLSIGTWASFIIGLSYIQNDAFLTYKSILLSETHELNISSAIIAPLLVIAILTLFSLLLDSRYLKAANLTGKTLIDRLYINKYLFRNNQVYIDYTSHFLPRISSIDVIKGLKKSQIQFVKLFIGGSNALTCLLRRRDTIWVRKYTAIAETQRLRTQYEWLVHAGLSKLNVVNVKEFLSETYFSYYDMDFFTDTHDFYEWSTCAMPDQVVSKFSEHLLNIHDFHSANSSASSFDNLKYIQEKVIFNLEFLHDQISFLPESFMVNESLFSKSNYNKFIEIAISDKINHSCSKIHGDLTLDNILIHNDRFIVIDPNPSDLYNSIFLDWAKVLQSVHYAYEWQIRNNTLNYDSKSINVDLHVPLVYKQLYKTLNEYLISTFGNDVLRSIRIHEIIHYFRMLKYKYDKSLQIGLQFTAILNILILDFLRDYEEYS